MSISEDFLLADKDTGHILAQFCKKNRIYTVPRQVLVFWYLGKDSVLKEARWNA
jgi:hypothetical protein